jgi:hypothetical protein
MATTGHSAAERTEQRRNRILAKRSARMAYAAGDRSIDPKSAPEEEVALPPRHGSDDAETLADMADYEPLTDEVNSVQAARVAGELARGPGGSTSPMLSPLVGFQLSAQIRTCIMVLSALVLAVVAVLSGSGARRLSAVQLFVQIQVMFHIPLLTRISSLLTTTSLGLGASGLLGIVSLVTSAALGFKMFYDDAVTFAFVFLVGIRISTWALESGYL